MDELVRQALIKWPDVPDCTGWLALDARGRWRVGEAKAGPRQLITNAAMIAYIGRNYVSADRYWLFQNGPQRVFVELEYTPFVWRLSPRQGDGWDLVSHTGFTAAPIAAWLDDQGRFLVEGKSSGGRHVGVVHDHDTALIVDLLRDDAGRVLDEASVTRIEDTQVHVATPIAAENVRVRFPPGDGAEAVELPLQRIASHMVPVRFGFEPRPSLALRVDVDTRR
jgi:hypothetical protein